MEIQKKYSKLLKDVLSDKNWEEDLEIIDILVSKGARIEVKDHPKFLKMNSEKFKKILKFFNYEDENNTIFYNFIALTSEQKNNPTIISNYCLYLSKIEGQIFKSVEMYSKAGKEGEGIFKTIFNLLIEQGNSLLLKKLINENIITKEKISDDDLSKSISRSLFVEKTERKENLESIKIIKNSNIISTDSITNSFIKSIGHSFFLYNRNRQTINDRTLLEYVSTINEELSDLNKIGILEEFKNKTNEVSNHFLSLQPIIGKMISTRKELFKDLRQADQIYYDLLNDCNSTLEQILIFEENKKKYGLKNEISFKEILKMYEDLINDFASDPSIKKSFFKDDKENKYKELTIKINKLSLENLLEDSQILMKKVKI